jgi:hypothetical protein
MNRRTTVRNFAFLLALAFLFFRFYNIRDSLLFINDMGRDFLVLLDWTQTGKPPLLGPQTSALPFNQSAWYFYLFYPFYLLSGRSPYATLITNAVIYLGTLFAGLKLTGERPRRQRIWLLVFALMTIHPTFIEQNRFVWNPSFVGPFLSLATIGYLRFKDEQTWKNALLSSFFLILAVSMNYSALPALLAFLLVGAIQLRRSLVKFIAGLVLSGLIVNAGTLVFELRHNFLLTKAVFRPDQAGQPNAPLLEKIIALPGYLLATNSPWFGWVLTAIVAASVAAYWYQRRQEKQRPAADWVTLAALTALTIGITVIAPVAVQKHYIFAMVTMLFFMIAALHRQLALLVIIILAAFWLRPAQIRTYFVRAPRTVADLQDCFALVCAAEKDPLYVSVETDLLPFHNGPEHRYFMRMNGCQVKDEYREPGQAKKMAVVVDNGTYKHGETAFHELTLFGPSTEKKVYSCRGNVRVHILEKN